MGNTTPALPWERGMRRPYLLSAVLLVMILLLPLASCSREQYRQVTVFSMDTPVTIKINASHPEADDVLAGCESLLVRLDALLSRTREGSDVWRINHTLVCEGLDAHTVAVLQTALSVSALTEGAFDITVAPLIELWETACDAGQLPSADALDAALALVDYRALTLEGNTLKKSDVAVRIDLGGIAKGYAADVICEYLTARGVEYGIVSFGSCVAGVGSKPDGKPFRIAVRDPLDTSDALGYVSLTHGVLSVTGDYERFYEIGGTKYHHVLSPETGYPARTVWHSVALVCESGAVADAMSTAIMVRGEFDTLYTAVRGTPFAFEGIFTGDGGTAVSEGMTDRFESKK